MKVMHYYTYPDEAGGPLTYLKNIVSCEYLKDITFAECYQNKPFSALRKRDFKRIVSEMKAFGPDILHIHGAQGEGFVGLRAAKKAKVKSLMTVHGVQIDDQRTGKLKRILFEKFIEPHTLKHCDGVYCVCRAMEEREYIQKNTKNLLPVLYNFIPDRFLSAQGEPLELPDHSGKTVITYVGRVTEEKGMKEFAYCVQNDGSDRTQYWVVGDGDYRAAMEEMLLEQVKAGKVIFFGQQKNVKAFWQETDIFLFPTYHENLSIALLEAASQKCCCLVSHVGGNPEVVEDGVCGLTFAPKSPQETLEVLQKVLNAPELAQQYARAIYQKISEEFSEEVFAKKLRTIYER
jgi:glycosyltransferase involved in cell wall biosynthesis